MSRPAPDEPGLLRASPQGSARGRFEGPAGVLRKSGPGSREALFEGRPGGDDVAPRRGSSGGSAEGRLRPRRARRRPFGEGFRVGPRGLARSAAPLRGLCETLFPKNRGFIENLNASKRKPLPLLPSRRGPRNGPRKGLSALLSRGPWKVLTPSGPSIEVEEAPG